MSRDDTPRHFVIAYDISSDATRRAVAWLLKGWGVRVQHRVFECSSSAPLTPIADCAAAYWLS